MNRHRPCCAGVLAAGLAVGIGAVGLGGQELSDISGAGPEHEALATLVGDWSVFVPDRQDSIGRAVGSALLDGRFFQVEVWLDAGPVGHVIYIIGFDRRHEEFTVAAMDDTGTYLVSARGTPSDDGRIKMYGIDDEPTMTAMGLTKEFVIALTLRSKDRFMIETLMIDMRTEARTEIPFFVYELSRGGE